MLKHLILVTNISQLFLRNSKTHQIIIMKCIEAIIIMSNVLSVPAILILPEL